MWLRVWVVHIKSFQMFLNARHRWFSYNVEVNRAWVITKIILIPLSHIFIALMNFTPLITRFSMIWVIIKILTLLTLALNPRWCIITIELWDPIRPDPLPDVWILRLLPDHRSLSRNILLCLLVIPRDHRLLLVLSLQLLKRAVLIVVLLKVIFRIVFIILVFILIFSIL